jgi:hypothetical protein
LEEGFASGVVPSLDLSHKRSESHQTRKSSRKENIAPLVVAVAVAAAVAVVVSIHRYRLLLLLMMLIFYIVLHRLEGDFLRLVKRGPVDGFELVHEFSLEGLVVGVGPGPVFVQWLRDADLEVHAAPADLAGDAGPGKFLEFGKELVEDGLAGLEALRVAGSTGGARGVLQQQC